MKKPPCPDRREAIERLVCGQETDPGLREHLLVCPACNAYYREQRRIEALFETTGQNLDDPLLRGYERSRRVSPVRIAAAGGATLAVVVVSVLGAVFLPDLLAQRGPGGSAPVVAATDGTMEAPAPVPPSAPPPSPSDPDVPVFESETVHLVTAEGEHVVQSFEGGLRLSLVGPGEASVTRSAPRRFAVDITDGRLVASVPETAPHTHVTVEAENLRVTVVGTLFAVVARDGRITSVEVESGRVAVASKIDQNTRMLDAGQIMSVEALAVRAREHAAPSLLTAFLVMNDDLLDPVSDPTTETAEQRASPAHHKKVPDKSAASAEAAPATPYEKAKALRAEGKYAEAVEAFLVAAKTGPEADRERSLYMAADLSLSKLGDTKQAILLSTSYLKNYPQGFYAEDARILQARAHMRAQDFQKARAVLVAYLADYPEGTQAALAHLYLGKIFATSYGNCAAARPHLESVIKIQPKGKKAKQAAKILEFCDGK